MPSNAQKLQKIGRPSSGHKWPDYVQEYGLDASDIPELITYITDKTFLDSRPSSRKFWAPLHAWRALGQMQAEAALAPLLQQMPELLEDDYAVAEIPVVLGMLGPAAVEPAYTLLCAADEDETLRIMGLDTLTEVAKRHPEEKARVLTLYDRYLDAPDPAATGLNSLLVLQLAELGALDFWPRVVPLFEQGWVDETLLDREDAEIEFGLREERDSPRRGAAADPDSEQPEGEEAQAIDVVEYYLDKYGADEAILGAAELDGFFSGIACAPNTLVPSEWLPSLWGGEELMPDWETEEEIHDFHDALLEEYNLVMEEFITGEFSAMFYNIDEPDAAHFFVRDWCNGFLRAANLYSTMPDADRYVFERHTELVRLYASETGSRKLETMSKEEIAAQQQAIEADVTALQHHFFQRRVSAAHTPFVSTSPKVGRNDLCPCGSGKKFKNCCLH